MAKLPLLSGFTDALSPERGAKIDPFVGERIANRDHMVNSAAYIVMQASGFDTDLPPAPVATNVEQAPAPQRLLDYERPVVADFLANQVEVSTDRAALTENGPLIASALQRVNAVHASNVPYDSFDKAA